MKTVTTLDDPLLNTYTFEGLLPDTYYFAVTAINSAGIESNFSNFQTWKIDLNGNSSLVNDTR